MPNQLEKCCLHDHYHEHVIKIFHLEKCKTKANVIPLCHGMTELKDRVHPTDLSGSVCRRTRGSSHTRRRPTWVCRCRRWRKGFARTGDPSWPRWRRLPSRSWWRWCDRSGPTRWGTTWFLKKFKLAIFWGHKNVRNNMLFACFATKVATEFFIVLNLFCGGERLYTLLCHARQPS